MKRTLAIILVISMLVCMLPAFSLGITAAEDEEVKTGLNADFYAVPGINNHDGAYKGIIKKGEHTDAYCGFEGVQTFDSTIDQLLKISANGNSTVSENLNAFPPVNAEGGLVVPGLDGYMIQWKGTVTASESGTYYLAAHKIDNGFVAFVKQGEEMKKVYEYWAAHNWFDADGLTLRTNLGGFTLEKDVPTEVELWYLESGGGQALEISVATSEDGALINLKDASSPLTFEVEGTCWRTNINADNNTAHNTIKDVLGAGVTADGDPATDNNGCQASMDANHLFDSSYTAIKERMVLVGSTVVPNFESDAIRSSGRQFGIYGNNEIDDAIIEFSGYFTVNEGNGGTYQFGTRNVDNCLMVEIEIDGEWTRVYEFWAKNIWNDQSDTFYQVEGQDVTVALEEGESYAIRAYFLEINGGNPIETIVKVDGERKKFVDLVSFTTAKPVGAVRPTNVAIFDNTQEWYYKTSGTGNEFQIRDDAWMTDAEVYGTWEKTTGTFGIWSGTEDNPVNNQSIWAVTTFEIASLEEIEGYELMMKIAYDDNIRMHINGELVNIETGWSNGTATWSLAEEATDLLVEGTNTVAMKLVQGWGGFSVKVESLYLTLDENTNAPYEYKYTDKNGVKQSGVITTADQWLAYVADANARGTANKEDRILIAADLDFEGKEWVAIDTYVGRIFGNYHSFKNITYTATVDGTQGTDGGVAAGLFTNKLTNDNGNGHIENLTFENCKLTVNATVGEGKEKSVIVGIVAGMVDRGRIENVTVKGCTIDGNASAAGAVVGVANWDYDQNGVHVENCAIIDTTVTATAVAGGAVAYARGNNTVRLGNVYAKGVALNAPLSDIAYGSLWGWEGEKVVLHSTTLEGENAVGKTLASDAEANYKFYYQTKPGADGTTDYRILCVANKEWATSQSSIKVSISFFDESLEKSTVATATTVYEKLKATSDGLTEVYTTDAESVVFGWVVKGVPTEFLEEEPIVELAS